MEVEWKKERESHFRPLGPVQESATVITKTSLSCLRDLLVTHRNYWRADTCALKAAGVLHRTTEAGRLFQSRIVLG